MTELQELLRRWTADGPVRRNRGKLDVVLDDGDAVRLEVSEISSEEIELVARWDAPSWWATTTSAYLPPVQQLAQGVVEQRSGLLRAEVSGNDAVLRMTVYLDGASRQSFMTAATEVARAKSMLDRITEDLQPQLAALADSDRQVQEAQTALQAAQRAAADAEADATSKATNANGGSGAPRTQAPPAAQATWQPTHRVPPEGMSAWATPDPSGVATPLAGNLGVQVASRTGSWAQVVASNGWSGWVDGRRLLGA